MEIINPQPEKTSPEEERTRRAFFLILILSIITGIVAFLVLLQDLVSGDNPGKSIVAVGVAFLCFVGAYLVKRGRVLLAVGLVAIALFSLTLGLTTQLAQVGLPLTLGFTAILILIASQVLPPRYITRSIIAVAATGILILLLDLFWPQNRPAIVPFALYVIYVGSLAMMGIALFVAVRQFPTYSLRTKLIAIAITLVVITVLLTTVAVNAITRRELTKQLNQEFKTVSQSQAAAVSKLLGQQVSVLQALSLDSTLRNLVHNQNISYSGSDEKILNEILNLDTQWVAFPNEAAVISRSLNNAATRTLQVFQRTFPEHANILVTDQYGAIAGNTYQPPRYYQGDEEWWQAAYNDGKGSVYIGKPEFDPAVGAVTLPIAVPIYTADTNNVLGVLYTSYSLDQLLALLEISDELGEGSEVDLLFGNQALHYEGGHHEEDGLYHLQAVEADSAVLEYLRQNPGENLMADVEGVPSVITMAPVTTDSYVPAVDELGWSVLVHQDQTAAFAAIAGQRRVSIVLGLVAVVIGSVLAAYSAQRITGPINRLTETAVHIAEGDLNSRAPVETQDEIGTLAAAFNSMTAQLRDFIGSLEERVADRTQALSTSAEVSRRLSTIVEVDRLVSEVVNQMRDAFGYYYAQIYLFDAFRKTLVMAGGTGEAGQAMLASGHTLQPGQGLVGRAVANNKVVLIDDVAQEAAWLPNELLPDTRSEIAVPIAIGGKVLGVLDIQHNIIAGFNEESAELLQAIANQVAIAIQNARTFEQLQQQEEALIDALEESGEQARRLALLSEMGALFNAAKDLDEVYKIAGPRILDIVYGEWAVLSLLDPSGETFHTIALTDQAGAVELDIKTPLAGTLVGWAVRENRFISLPRDASFDEFPDARRLYAGGIQSAVVAPLTAGGRAIGALGVASRYPESFEALDVNFAQQIAALLASTIEGHILAERARLLASVVEDHPDFVGTGTLDGKMLYINPAGLQMVGLPQDYDVTQMSLTDFYSAEDAERLIQEGIPAALTSGGWTYEAVVFVADGRQLAVEETIGINHDADGNPLSFNMTLHDITERKEAEKAIRESEARLHTLIEYAPEAVVVLDGDTGLFTEVNENAALLFGMSREELFSVGPFQLSPERQPDGRYSTEAAQEKIEAALAGEALTFDWVHRSSDGRDIPCELRLVKLPGTDNLIRASITDITERQKAQAAMAKLASDLQIVTEVSRAATTILDTEQLLQQVVDLTKERFGLYHVHIYLMGEDKQRLNLVAGAGELGQMMVADGYQIPLAEKDSLVARAARTRQGVIVNDVREEAGFLSNPLLPGTRSELAAPLIVSDEVLGVLDVQSDEVDYFGETDINIQTTLALQIAAALQNAIQYQKAQEALAELTKLQQIMVREGWESYLQEDHLSGYVYDLHQLQPLEPKNDAVDPVAGLNLNDTAVCSPLTVRGATIGTLGIYDPSGQPVSPEKQYLLESISQQVAEALERARLFEETEIARRHLDQRAEELAVLNRVAEEAARQLDVNGLFSAVHRQIRRVFAADTFFAALYNSEQNWFDFVYFYDHGRQTQVDPLPADPFYETVQVYQDGQPIIINF
ncbi:MAG TPA: GAF domain-containing protein, partial [Anaerolineae bacterium]|nr:GAF domain-containing protein [Anaerolineae bacterium]